MTSGSHLISIHFAVRNDCRALLVDIVFHFIFVFDELIFRAIFHNHIDEVIIISKISYLRSLSSPTGSMTNFFLFAIRNDGSSVRQEGNDSRRNTPSSFPSPLPNERWLFHLKVPSDRRRTESDMNNSSSWHNCGNVDAVNQLCYLVFLPPRIPTPILKKPTPLYRLRVCHPIPRIVA